LGSDLCLIAATGFGKTIVFTGYYTPLKPESRARTVGVRLSACSYSQLSNKLRAQLEPHTRLFGTTATLRPDTCKEIRETAGFHPEPQPMRTSIYQSNVYLYMHPTDERLIPEMIFFVRDVRETTDLRGLLVQWFELRLGRQLLYPIARAYHGEQIARRRILRR
jgi:hypothetical protein